MILKHIRSHDHDHDEEENENDSFIISNNWGPNVLTFFGKDSRAILITGEIEEMQASCIISQLFDCASQSEEEPIYVYINTGGGDVISGLAIYDAMRIVPCPVVTVVIGACHSAGLFILQGGDRRTATPHSSFFYHEPIASYTSNTEVATIANSDHYKYLKDRIDGILLKRSKMNKTIWKNNFAGKTGFFFDAEKALEYKLIDEVIDYAKPKPIKIKED